MSYFIQCRGGEAWSAFRLEKLQSMLSAADIQLSTIRTEYWYFIENDTTLSAREESVLLQLLEEGSQIVPSTSSITSDEQLFLVIPRLGTLSPWASKATDIAQQCGLSEVRRIERGVAFWVKPVNPMTDKQQRDLQNALHDRMTETVLPTLAGAQQLFTHIAAQPLHYIDILNHGRAVLGHANGALGLALSADEMDYLLDYFQRIERNPTDVELMMFAQANSEHCRHKIFNAEFVIDGQPQAKSLFKWIQDTHNAHPQGTLVAYKDNSSVIEGATIGRFYPDSQQQHYAFHHEQTDILMKVETHNHPTAIAPFAGAATGSGGEIRDEGATGRGGRPKAGLTGYTVSHLAIPACPQPWEAECQHYGKPAHMASALQIMLEAPIGAAAFNNEFGRPNLTGYFRAFEGSWNGEIRGYHKPIMIAGGVGNIQRRHLYKQALPEGALLVQLGGAGLLIGLGGGAASSMATGSNDAELDFNSVQRGNPEMEHRCQEVIDRCWQLGDDNPILSIHDVGAGGLSNALPELINDAQCGGLIELRQIPIEEHSMTPMQIWCNESQERYVLAIHPDDLERFSTLCRRENCPFAVVGVATAEGHLAVTDQHFEQQPVDLPLNVLLGKPPRMLRHVERQSHLAATIGVARFDLHDSAYRVLRHPAVADKSFLITIGDRTVGGMTCRDQMVGPWQVPVADVAVTAMGFTTYRGEAMAMGERSPVALVNAPASGRLAIAEALTNLAAAYVSDLGQVKLSANWMAAAGHKGEEAALYDTVAAVSRLSQDLGLSIPVGKDSLSMKTVWQDQGQDKAVISPLSVIISAFAPVNEVRKTVTPQLQTVMDSQLILIDLGQGKARLGGSILGQVWNQLDEATPDIDEVALLKAFFCVIQDLLRDEKILAYHDRSDGGLFVTLAEMLFASHLGLSININSLMAGKSASTLCKEHAMRVLFNEEIGAVIQVEREQVQDILARFAAAGLGSCTHIIGTLNAEERLTIADAEQTLLDEPRQTLQNAWSETSMYMQRLRDNPDCAIQEYAGRTQADDSGLFAQLTFDVQDNPAAPYIGTGARPLVAILREQGVNGQIEMAAAFDRAGFSAVDVHMNDLLGGKANLADFHGLAACGGFSYGDVLGAGTGWAKRILLQDSLREQFYTFFHRENTFALGVCNGCQMLSQLATLIPGAEHWPRFKRNRSEQFEARFSMVEVTESPSIFLKEMIGSRLPVVVSHGEGQAVFAPGSQDKAQIALRYIDHLGQATERYPQNPNGSPGGITGVTTADGRFTIMMPHPERVFRTVQNSWHPHDWGENGAWFRLFATARKWLDK